MNHNQMHKHELSMSCRHLLFAGADPNGNYRNNVTETRTE